MSKSMWWLVVVVAVMTGLTLAGLSVARDRDAGPEERNPDRIRAHLHELEQRIEDLQNEGAKEDAAHLKQEAQRLRQHLHRMQQAGRDDPERRVRHMMEAAKHLEAAGLRDVAHKIAKEAEQMRRSLGRGNLEHRVQELTEQVHHLHEQVEELRSAYRRLHEQMEERLGDRNE